MRGKNENKKINCHKSYSANSRECASCTGQYDIVVDLFYACNTNGKMEAHANVVRATNQSAAPSLSENELLASVLLASNRGRRKTHISG